MRKSIYFLLPLAMLAAGCVDDIITIEDDSTQEVTTLTDPELSWTASSYEATIGADNVFPTLKNEYGVSVTYSSSDTGVATIDSDGNITLVAAGSTSIMASSSADDTYSSSSASYALTVIKSGDGIAWSASSCTVTYGGSDNTFPTLSNPGKQTITYSSSNENVATIGSDGTVTLVAEGETTITASAEANDAYEASSASYTLTVEGVLKSAGLSWSASSITATLASDDNSFPTLSNPNGLEVTYSSSDEAVATISSDGTVTLVGAGTASIIANSEATDVYASGSAYYTLKVVKNEVTLEWSASSCKAVLEEDNSFPTLTVTPAGADITVAYSSANTNVAAISQDGSVKLVAAGSTTISATFSGNDIYKAASASYTLTVTSGSDDGAGTFTYSSTGDSSSEDDISNTTFTRMITITYASGGASVTGDYYGYVTVSGNNVTVNNTGSENIVYMLTGSASSGYFKLYSTKKQAILLSGLTLTNPNGAVINNQSGKRTFIMVEGTNTLSDGSSAAYSADGDEDMKGVLFSEGQIIFSGSGTLTVNASNKQSKSGIVSDDYVRIMDSPTINVTAGSSAGHGVRGKEYVQLTSGKLGVSTAANMKKGVGSDDYVLVEGGTHTITVTGGVAYDSDDAEYKGTAGIKADNYFAMTGGTVTIKNTGSGGKGVSAGSYDYDSSSHALSDSYISGGTLNITTTGSESQDVSSKGIKIGYKEASGRSYVYAGNLIISGGKVIVNCSKSESIEAKGTLKVNGGEVYAVSSADDAINCQGEMNINDGYVYAYSSQNDAIDANGNLKLNGGYVFAVTTKGSPEVAIDANTESGYKLYINSGVTLVAYGGLESGYSASQTVYSMSGTANAWNALYNGKSFIAAFKAPAGISSFVVSAPSLSAGYKGVSVSGSTYCNGIWATEGISGGTSVSLSSYSGGAGGPGGGGGPGGRW